MKNDKKLTAYDGMMWINTGDLGCMNDDLCIEDVKNRMIIKYGGFEVNPTMIEKAIMTIPAIVNVAVIGVKDTEHPGFAYPKANIVLDKELIGYKGYEETVLAQAEIVCKLELPDYCVPTYWEVKDKLPLTKDGKIDYKLLELEANNEIENMEPEIDYMEPIMPKKLKLSKLIRSIYCKHNKHM